MVVLVIDDNLSFIKLFRLYSREFSKLDYTFSTSAKEAISILNKDKKKKISLVVCDIRMPYMSGFDIINYINSKRPGLPVVLITALDIKYLSKEDLERAHDVIVKDIGIEKIIHRIEEISKNIENRKT